MNRKLKKYLKFLYSMKFGIGLLIVIALLSLLGTLIPQGNDPLFYEQNYSKTISEIILTFDLDDLYFSPAYLFLTGLLLINLFFCSINRFRPIFTKSFKDPSLEKFIDQKEIFVRIRKSDDFSSKIKKIGFSKLKNKKLGSKEVYYAFDGKIGHLGSWLTHLSIIIIILAFTYGKFKGFDEFVYGLPGEVLSLENEDYDIRIDNYKVLFRKDYTVDQYISDLTILDKGGRELLSGKSMVNQPLRFDKFNVYQNSTGWALDAYLFKDDKSYKEKVLYNSEVFVEDDQKIALQLVDFYPDFTMEEPSKPTTKSPFLNHPVALYALFYDGVRVDMGLNHLGDPIEYENYTFVLKDPKMFTLLQVASDPARGLALLGGLILLIGLFLAFYINPKTLILVKEDTYDLLYIGQGKNDKAFTIKKDKILEELEVD
ncbi:MAG: cytochrome c biogenesis protein ResB [Anaerococcus sp.]|nr:cytochrome c biogenesis protein ResB [Anaerococcus sp.]